MKQSSLIIAYREYEDCTRLPQEDRVLLEEACRAAQSAYAPYSRFQVGAAVRLADGTAVRGSNQENAAYPSGICAERTALFFANSNFPDAAVRSIAVTAYHGGQWMPTPTFPCGACRQVLAECEKRAGSPIRIIVGSSGKVLVFDSVRQLLPFVFDNLPGKKAEE